MRNRSTVLLRRFRNGLGLALLAWLVYAVGTGGGVMLIARRNYSFESMSFYVGGASVSLKPQPWSVDFFLPGIGGVDWEGPPTRLQLGMQDHFGRYASIEIAEAVVEYPGGRQERLASPFVHRLAPAAMPADVITNQFQFVTLRSPVIRRHSDFTLTCRGFLIRPDGRKTEFSRRREIKADTSYHFWTGWTLLGAANC